MITLYTTSVCHFCVKTKEYLKAKGLAWVEHNVQTNPPMAAEMIRKTGQMGVPVIDIDGKIIIGFNKQKLDELL